MTRAPESSAPSHSPWTAQVDLDASWLGQHAHRRYQAERETVEPSFRSEVAVRGTWTVDQTQLEVGGRVDGLFRNRSGELRVEEVKTRLAAEPSTIAAEAARCQAEVYARLIEQSEGERCRAEVVWIDRAGGELSREALTEERGQDLDERVGVAIRRAQRESELRKSVRARTAESVGKLRTPVVWHPEQDALRRALEEAVSEGDSLLIEAPTGSGKTLAVLHGALTFALSRSQPLWFLTPKRTQQRHALSELRRLAPAEILPAVRRGSRASLCHTGASTCADCPRAAAAVPPLEKLMGAPDPTSPSEFSRYFETRGHCAYWSARALSREVPVVVGDFDLLFRQSIYDAPPSPFETARPAPLLVVDEIHQLPERSRAFVEVELTSRAIDIAHREVAQGEARALRALRAALEDLREGLFEWAEGSEHHRGALDAWGLEAAEDRFAHFDDAFASFAEYARIGNEWPSEGEQAVLRVSHAVNRFREISEGGSSWLRPVAFIGEDGPGVALWCHDTGAFLSEAMQGCESVVGLSATLPPRADSGVFGLDSQRCAVFRSEESDLVEKRGIWISGDVATEHRKWQKQLPRLAGTLTEIAAATPGHIAIFVPSFAWIEALRGLLGPIPRLLVQEAGSTDGEREAHLRALRSGEPSACLLAVSTGVFAEGVDFSGGALDCVAVIGPPVPPPTLPREWRRNAVDDFGGDGFDAEYAEPAMRAVRQAAGRLWRSPMDSGALLLLGKRFLRAPYSEHLPRAWRRASKLECAELPSALEEFFGPEVPDSAVGDVNP